MRILLVTQYYWPENFPINSLTSKLVERGLDITVLTGKPNYPDGNIFSGYQAGGTQIERHNNVTILRVPIVPRGDHFAVGLILNYLSFIVSALIWGTYLVRARKYDLVFVYAPSPLLQALPAIWLANIRRVPLVVWVQDLWPESLSATGFIQKKWLLNIVASIVRCIYKSCDCILVQSQAFISPVAKLTDDINKIYYYPNHYQPLSSGCSVTNRAEELVKILRSHFCIVFAGNLGTAQGLEVIIGAARLLKSHTKIRIVLVGGGSRYSWLEQERDSHGLNNLILAGRFEESDMHAIFSAAEVLLVSLDPNPAFNQTIPSKIQAYLFAGRPILASLSGEGARIVVESGAGLCSESGDADALANNMLKIEGMTSLMRQQMGLSGRQYFDEHFSPSKLTDELVEHFKEIISRSELQK
jgi:glycosyltransferase involved in cell wall biosynthesis